MNNYVKGLVAVVILIALWAGVSYVQSVMQTDNAPPDSKKTDEACATSPGGG